MIKHILVALVLVTGSWSLQAQGDAASTQKKNTTEISLDELLTNYFENIGGMDAWRKLNATRMEGSVSMQGMEFDATIVATHPNKTRIDVNAMGQQIVQAYDGEDAWWINPFQGGTDPQTMPEEMAEGMRSEDFQDGFLDYKDKGNTVEILGTEEIEGADTYKVKLTKKSGDIKYYYFDQESFVPILIEQPIKQGPQKGQMTQTFLSDYEEVEGYVMPHYLEVKVAGQTGQAITIKKVEINPELDKAYFSRPKQKE